jgi:protein-S-isoprenylcysteine O-methyltransferase Ste14
VNTRIRRRLPPLWLLAALSFLIYLVFSALLTMALSLPWLVPIPKRIGITVGVILLVLGFTMITWAFKSLGLRRILGKELFLSKSESKLIAAGVYAYSRNPLYFFALVLLLGWFFVFRLTPILILTLLFLAHFVLLAKWEERELKERFGQEYEDYRQHVPFFVPRLKWK